METSVVKYSHLNLKQIRSGLFADIIFDLLAYTGKEHRLLQVVEVFYMIPIYNCSLNLKIKFTYIIFISCGYDNTTLHFMTLLLS